jgi:tRNA(His) 5'-end guanylyltransferase
MDFDFKIYEKSYDYKIIPNLPIVVKCEIRNYARLVKNLPIPCIEMLDLMTKTMFMSILDIECALFGYQSGGEINFILKNNEAAETANFYNNRIQSINSVISSLVTTAFIKNYLAQELENIPDTIGDAIFNCNVFALPSVNDAVDYLCLKQHNNYISSLESIVKYEFTKNYSDKYIKNLLNKPIKEIKDILLTNFQIDFDNYPVLFRFGSAAYKTLKIFRKEDHDIQKKKWILDISPPSLLADKNFITNILMSGHDVFREDRDLIIFN